MTILNAPPFTMAKIWKLLKFPATAESIKKIMLYKMLSCKYKNEQIRGEVTEGAENRKI